MAIVGQVEDDRGTTLFETTLASQTDNKDFHLVSLREPKSSRAEAVWEVLPWSGLPRLAVMHPPRVGKGPEVAWTGRVENYPGASFWHSPAREELVEKLLAEESAVYLVLESGDREKDHAFQSALRRELNKIAAVIDLEWKRDAEKKNEDASKFPEIRFSTLSVSRDDADEEALISFLESLAGEQRKLLQEEPAAFPVFGRGRVMPPHAGMRGLRAWIDDTARFLCADCSCTSENATPGSSMPIRIDWQAEVEKRWKDETVQPLPSLAVFRSQTAGPPAPPAPQDETEAEFQP